MKKISGILVVILLLFMNCDMRTADEVYDDLLLERASGHDLYYNSVFDGYTPTYEIIALIINSYVWYEPDVGADVWSNPKETFERGYGDCEDYAILFMSILYYRTGERAKLGIVHTDNARTIIDGGRVNHAVVILEGGVIFDPVLSEEVAFSSIGYVYTFEEVFN